MYACKEARPNFIFINENPTKMIRQSLLLVCSSVDYINRSAQTFLVGTSVMKWKEPHHELCSWGSKTSHKTVCFCMFCDLLFFWGKIVGRFRLARSLHSMHIIYVHFSSNFKLNDPISVSADPLHLKKQICGSYFQH